jgi:hypothetical protein
MTRSSGSLNPLRDRLVALAGTPDDGRTVTGDLDAVAQLATDRVMAVSYASVTTSLHGGYVTVAASSDLARAVDEAQYADGGGPCLSALERGQPAAVSDIAATMGWPGFRDTAAKFGLRASLSVPLFAGRGTPIAALNLYSHHPEDMRPLSGAVRSVYDLGQRPTPDLHSLDPGGGELVSGLIAAFAVRAVVQQAIGVVMALTGAGPDAAYESLCDRATTSGVPLTQAAGRLISGHR